MSARARRRLAGALVAAAAASILGVAWWLEPSVAGMGTHQQMGLPPCGWVAGMGIPCPTCGMTTSYALAADGRLGASVVNQPAGALLALATAMALIVGVHTAITGASTHLLLLRLWRWWMAWMLIGILVGAWIWKLLLMKGVIG